MEIQPASSPDSTPIPVEVSGWLLTLCLILTFVYPGTSFYRIFSHTIPTAISTHALNRMLLLFVYAGVFSVVAVLSFVAGLKLWLVRPHAVRFARRYLVTYLIANVGYFIFWIAVIWPTERVAYAEMGWYHVVAPVGSVALWYSYLEHSKRVRKTYPVT